jgi:hypothetical protein
MKTYTYDETVAMLEEIVDSVGSNYVYKQDQRGENQDLGVDCNYYENGYPSCGVGHVFHRVGLTEDRVAVLEGRTAYQAIRYLQEMGTVAFDGKSTDLLYRFQQCQDEGMPWGESLSHAKQYAENVNL